MGVFLSFTLYKIAVRPMRKGVGQGSCVVRTSENIFIIVYSMCSLVVSVLVSPAVDPRSNPGSGSALLMSEKSQTVYYISSCHMLIDKALSSDKPNGQWFEAD